MQMDTIRKKVRGLGLCSGGLDSILAALVLKKQGIDVEWITFETPFFSADKARAASKMTCIPLRVQSITPVYLQMLEHPPCGYGKYMNPCLDCHALMFRLAGEVMRSEGMDFLFSGEVMGQRPMSQTRPSLRYVEKHSGFQGYILRPLSAKRLPETIPEQEGLVNRELLLDLAGRSRKPQIRLAKEFGITEYPAPAGGCLLTDRGYTVRLKDLFGHTDTGAEKDYHLLKHGRHFRLSPVSKIIVGRTQGDNEKIAGYYRPDADVLLKTRTIPGPLVLMPYGGDDRDRMLAAGICAAYSKSPEGGNVEIGVTAPEKKYVIRVVAQSPGRFRDLMI